MPPRPTLFDLLLPHRRQRPATCGSVREPRTRPPGGRHPATGRRGALRARAGKLGRGPGAISRAPRRRPGDLARLHLRRAWERALAAPRSQKPRDAITGRGGDTGDIIRELSFSLRAPWPGERADGRIDGRTGEIRPCGRQVVPREIGAHGFAVARCAEGASWTASMSPDGRNRSVRRTEGDVQMKNSIANA